MDELQPPYPHIKEMLQAGEVIPFIGAGVSLSGRNPAKINWDPYQYNSPPLASELADYLAKFSGFPESNKELATVAQYYELIADRTALEKRLNSILDHDYPLDDWHRFLAGIDMPMLIITTNYDDLLERAFLKQGHKFDLVMHSTEPAKGKQVLVCHHGSTDFSYARANELLLEMDQRTIIYKMHGFVDRRDKGQSNYVITEDDYVRFLTRMTKNAAIPAIFGKPFQERPFLFLGYGLQDWNLRVLLSQLGQIRSSWSIQHQMAAFEKEFWKKRNVTVFQMSLKDFLRKLKAAK